MDPPLKDEEVGVDPLEEHRPAPGLTYGDAHQPRVSPAINIILPRSTCLHHDMTSPEQIKF